MQNNSKTDYDALTISDDDFEALYDSDDEERYIVKNKLMSVDQKVNRYVLTRRELFDFKAVREPRSIFKI